MFRTIFNQESQYSTNISAYVMYLHTSKRKAERSDYMQMIIDPPF